MQLFAYFFPFPFLYLYAGLCDELLPTIGLPRQFLLCLPFFRYVVCQYQQGRLLFIFHFMRDDFHIDGAAILFFMFPYAVAVDARFFCGPAMPGFFMQEFSPAFALA